MAAVIVGRIVSRYSNRSNLGISNRREVRTGSSSNVLGTDLFKNSRTVVSETAVKAKSGLPLKGLPI